MVEVIIDNSLDEFYMIPVFLLQYAFEHKQNCLRGLTNVGANIFYCIFPPTLSEEEKQNA
jgi:hypothetical protein